ncbi:MAG: amidohydrolase family protein [Candidatus Omnitrophota bacterium]
MDDRKGSIGEGKDADLVVIDKELNVIATIVGGHVVYAKPAKYLSIQKAH